MLNVRIPPHGGAGGAVDVAVGQDRTVEGPENSRQSPVETQNPVQVEGKDLEPVLHTLDQRAETLLAGLTVALCSS